jgi:hypothetical protein
LKINSVMLMSYFRSCNKQFVGGKGNGVRGGMEVRGEAAGGLREDWAVDGQHGIRVEGSSPPCTEGHHPKQGLFDL